ncbi:MAG TPA: hypothetical protein EYP22_03750 [Methanosarcinales archaeon]|nr:hypothetical protein [Methanosarcinales archaeon]
MQSISSQDFEIAWKVDQIIKTAEKIYEDEHNEFLGGLLGAYKEVEKKSHKEKLFRLINNIVIKEKQRAIKKSK